MLQAPHRKLEVGSLLSDVAFQHPGRVVAPLPLAGGNIVSHASANTKGAWSDTLDPILYDLHGLVLQFTVITVNRDHLLDIGIGPTGGGSEVEVVSNLLFSGIPAGHMTPTIYLPLYLPGSAGKRLSARNQCSTGGTSISFRYWPVYRRQRLRLLRSVETFGANTADSGGTSIDPGGSAGTKGAYSTLGTTTHRISEIVVATGNAVNNVRANANWLADIAIGATPDIIVGDLSLVSSSSNDMVTPQLIGPFPVNIPPGTDVKVRSQCDIIDATDRLFDCVVYGLSEAK